MRSSPVFLILILLAVLPFRAPADPYLEGSAKAFLDRISRIDSLLTLSTGCPEFDDRNRPSCSSLSDNFCSKVWAEGNEGNLQVHDGALKMGWTKAGALRDYKRQDYEALIASLPRLPEDLKAKLEPVLQEFDKHLKEEKNTTAWLRTLADIDRKLERALADTELERWKARFPEASKKKVSERSVEERFEKTRIGKELRDEILEAKYKNHPNWLRVEKTFGKVQERLLKEIDLLEISSDRKEEMKEKVKSVKLSLPYTSPLKLGSDESCGTSTQNAFYDGTRHEFTMCAGYFNSIQSESNLAFIIGHEIGHSIDPNAKGRHDCREHSPVAATLNRLRWAKGAGMSCEEWKEAREKLLKPPSTFAPKNIDELDGFYACLKSRDGLLEYTPDSVLSAVERHTRQDLSWAADRDYFYELAVPTFQRNGKEVENEYFLRPDRLMLQRSSETQEGTPQRDAYISEIFTQAFSCQRLTVDGQEKGVRDDLSPLEREALVRAAMAETYEVLKAQKADAYSYCGQNCQVLVKEGLAASTGENFADWISTRALRHLLEEKENIEQIREATALIRAHSCEEPGLETAAPNIAAAQKEVSHLPHPYARTRRVSAYNLENARLAQCAIDPKDQGYALCEP